MFNSTLGLDDTAPDDWPLPPSPHCSSYSYKAVCVHTLILRAHRSNNNHNVAALVPRVPPSSFVTLCVCVVDSAAPGKRACGAWSTHRLLLPGVGRVGA